MFQITCWGPVFGEAAQTGGTPLWRRVAVLALRLTTQQRRASELVEAGRAREASLMLQVTAPQSCMFLRCIKTILMWIVTSRSSNAYDGVSAGSVA